MSEDQQVESYTWEIDGKRALNPDIFLQNAADNGYDLHLDDPLIMIDCPRGAQPGKARLLLSEEDAAAVIAMDTSQLIIIKKYHQTTQPDGSVNWQVSETYTFYGYYPISSKNAFGINDQNVIVELLDERYLMQSTKVRKRYNVVIKKGFDGFGSYNPLDDEYDPATLVTTDTPYTYQGILDDLLGALIDPPLLFLPVDYPPPRNLVFDCSLSDALDQLLASLGCILTYDPFIADGDNSYSIKELINNGDLSVLITAKNDGRLIERAKVASSDATLPLAVSTRPNDIIELDDEAKHIPPRSNASVVGGGTEIILINDHEFIPDSSRIESAVNAWYGERNHLLDETYYGILKQAPANRISSVRWSILDGRTQTRFQNYVAGEVPWPEQPALVIAKGHENSTKDAFIVQGLLGTRPGADPESEFPAWGGDTEVVYVQDSTVFNLSPPPYTNFTTFETCRNPHRLNGEEGDTFIAMRDPDANPEEDDFILIAVHSKKATIFFTFDDSYICSGSNLDSNDGTELTAYKKELAVTVKSWRHPGRGPEGFDAALKVEDTFLEAVNCQAGDVGYAEWNAARNKWSIVKAQHYARRIRGVTTGTVSTKWSMTPVIGYDGNYDSDEVLIVAVPAGWNYPGNGKVVWVEYNPEECEYEVYQAEADCEDV